MPSSPPVEPRGAASPTSKAKFLKIPLFHARIAVRSPGVFFLYKNSGWVATDCFGDYGCACFNAGFCFSHIPTTQMRISMTSPIDNSPDRATAQK